MRQIWIPRAGPPEVLEVREAPDPEPGPGEIRIRVEAAGVNFATFHLGRAQPGGDALSLIEIDDPISDDLLRQLGELPNVRQAKALKF